MDQKLMKMLKSQLIYSRLFIGFVIHCICLGCDSRDGNSVDEQISYYDDGETIKRVAYFLDGKPHGCHYEFYQNGDTAIIECFKGGELHGRVYFFYPNGGIKSLALYQKGEVIYDKGYYENGALFLETNFKDGNLHGPYIEGYENGKIRTQGQYFERIPTNTWSFYDSLGLKYQEIIYVDSVDIIEGNALEYNRCDTILYIDGDTIFRPGKPDEVIITIDD